MEPSVLLVHNRYRETGGEERLVEQLQALLRERGVDCQLLTRDSARASRLRAGMAMLRGGLDPTSVAQAVRQHGSNIVHVHNINPLLGVHALSTARAAGARVVMHLHNFRLFCAIGTAFRDGQQCFSCHDRKTWPGVRFNCRGSRAESAVYAASLAWHQSALFKNVDRFITPSRFAKERLEELGLPPERTDVLPNFLPTADFAECSTAHQGSYALYVGRLAPEKGVDTAIEAATSASVPLIVAGGGPQLEHYRALAAGNKLVECIGAVDHERLAELRAGAAFAVVPSRGPEVFPFAALESMAAGLPVLAANVGGLPELIGTDQLLPAGAVGQWTAAMQRLWKDPGERRALGDANLDRARTQFGADRYFERLIKFYGDLLS